MTAPAPLPDIVDATFTTSAGWWNPRAQRINDGNATLKTLGTDFDKLDAITDNISTGNHALDNRLAQIEYSGADFPVPVCTLFGTTASVVNVAANAYTLVPIPGVGSDPDGMIESGGGAKIIQPGIYHISGNVAFRPGDGGYRLGALVVNGVAFPAPAVAGRRNNNTELVNCPLPPKALNLAAGDTVRAYARSTVATATANSNPAQAFLSLAYMRDQPL